jgi:hypothetical protein
MAHGSIIIKRLFISETLHRSTKGHYDLGSDLQHLVLVLQRAA